MVRLLQHIASLLFVLALCTTCDEGYYSAPEEELIVEGWIEDGGFPVVIVTKSLPICNIGIPLKELANDHLIRYAKVTVSDGEQSVILTGKSDAGYIPPYIYTTGNLRGESGKTYHLKVEYENFCATASTTIPASPAIKSIQAVRKEKNVYSIEANFEQNPNSRHYYCCFVKENPNKKQYFLSYMGCLDDSTYQEEKPFPIYPGSYFNKEEDYLFFPGGDSISVKISSVDSISYRFWNEYNKRQILSSNMFFPIDTDLFTNIRGGSGYWCGYATTTRHFILPTEWW